MDNWGIILHNHIIGFVILLFIIGIINILIALKLCKEIMASKKYLEETIDGMENTTSERIELIKKESW